MRQSEENSEYEEIGAAGRNQPRHGNGRKYGQPDSVDLMSLQHIKVDQELAINSH